MVKLNGIMVIVMVLSLTVFIGIGIPQVQPGAFSVGDEGYFSGGAIGFANSVAIMGIPCQGSNMLVSCASETKKPTRSIPIALLITTVIAGIIPILTGMNLGQIASYVMTPVMLLSMLNNILFMNIPKKYPNAWKRSFFYMPMPALAAVVILSILADPIVCAAMFTTLEESGKIIVPALMSAVFFYSFWRLKSGKVTMKSVEEAKRHAMEEIHEMEER